MAVSPTAVKNTIDAATTILKVVKEIVLPVIEAGTKIGNKIDQHQRDISLSLTAYTKQTTLRSRVYIDASLADEPITSSLVRALHTMYIGLVLNALQLNQFVTSGKTVRDLVGSVATEAYAEPYRNVLTHIAETTAALEAYTGAQSKDMLDAAKTHQGYTKDELEQEGERRRQEDLKNLGKTPESKGANQFAAKDIQLAPAELAPIGKMVEITLTSPDNPGASSKLLLTVQMVPYLIPAKLAAMFINKDTSLSFSQRIMQWKAGEISFWRDLLFQVDRINKSAEIVRNDPNKVFYDFMANVAKKDRAALTKNLAQPSATKSHNLANSVMIFSTGAVAQAKAESGIDLHEREVRQRYFRDTYAMAIAVVDTLYNQVTLYLNGIDDVGVYAFSQFERKTNDKDGGVDLLKLLSTFTAGKAPARF